MTARSVSSSSPESQGIGKTSLVSRFARLAHREGAVVVAGRCDEGYDVPYQPFIEALAPLLEHTNAVGARRLDPRLGAEIGRILPDVADRPAGLSEPGITDPETDRYRLFEAVAAWLASVAEQVPLVLVIDDVHWASAPTSLLLRHLARYPAPGLFVIATYRSTEVPLATRFAELLAGMQRETDFQVLDVGGLGAPDIDALLTRVRGDGDAERDAADGGGDPRTDRWQRVVRARAAARRRHRARSRRRQPTLPGFRSPVACAGSSSIG